MRKLILLLGLVLQVIIVNAQSVSGSLVDEKGNPVSFANVVLPLLWLGLSQRIWQTYQNESNDEIVKRYLDENFF